MAPCLLAAGIYFTLSQRALEFFGFRVQLFLVHVLCMGLAGVVLLPTTTACIAMRGRAPAALRKVLAVSHGVTNIALVAVSAVGFWAIFQNKNLHGKAHFTSWHSWAGLATLALWLMNLALGLQRLVALGSWQWRHVLHRLVGTLAGTISLGAVVTGIWSQWGQAALGAHLQWILTALIGLVASLAQGTSLWPSAKAKHGTTKGD